MNPLVELNRAGQSVWLDFVSRNLLDTGGLKRLIEKDGVSGVTSNPSIFQKAISGSRDYDDAFRALLKKGMADEKELFIALAVEDIARAADQLKPVYDATGGEGGYVSIEVSPDLAYNTQETMKEARMLFSALSRKNILIKVPATKEGLPAIRQLISEGINVNVTLLFAVERYLEVMAAYIGGLSDRAARGLKIDEVASVASFFVSRVDTAVDKLLDAEGGNSGLRGKAAVANAKLAYKKYRETFDGQGFAALKEQGARVQRLLWGSTGTKDPAYSDIKYVEEIIGPGTINTMPEPTMDAFRDHGKVAPTVTQDLADAEKALAELGSLGIDLKAVTGRLEDEGVKAFSDSFFALLDEIKSKTDALK